MCIGGSPKTEMISMAKGVEKVSGGVRITFEGKQVSFAVFADGNDGCFTDLTLERLCYTLHGMLQRYLYNVAIWANPRTPDLSVIEGDKK